jgi:AAA+ ATPase superfamily predicted ATPase
MMQGLVLDAAAPLYGRAAEAFALQPLPPAWLAEALGCGDPVEAVNAYAVWGGIPRYWELAQPFGAALDDAVESLALNPMGPLHTEPERLLLEETPPAIALRPVLDAIGGGSHRLSEIAGRLGCPATSLSRPLTRMQELGLVIRETPFGESEKGGKRALYKIADPFIAFWFQVVAPRRGFLAGATKAARLAVWRKLKPVIVARVWEDLCRRAAPTWAAATVGGVWHPAGRWWRANLPEWDIAATALDGKRGLVGEAKWSESVFDEHDLREIGERLTSRSLPPDLPAEIERVIFVPRASKNVKRRTNGWRVVDAAEALAYLK